MSLKKNDISLVQLKGKTKIVPLFESGKIYRTPSLLLRVLKDEKSKSLAAAVSVSKKNFAKAVDRNRIKRQLRVALNSFAVQPPFSGVCMLIYTGKEMPQTAFLNEETKRIFEKTIP